MPFLKKFHLAWKLIFNEYTFKKWKKKLQDNEYCRPCELVVVRVGLKGSMGLKSTIDIQRNRASKK